MTLELLQKYLDESQNIVFFGGAGVSTESGLPDFRGEGGLFRQKYAYAPEYMLSSSFFRENPKVFYKFHKEKMIPVGFGPNPAHYKLAELEKAGKLKAVITQNVDGFHQRAGSRNVLELHGSVYRNYCLDCHESYPVEYILECESVPYCECGGLIRPDVVLYGEALDDEVVGKAIKYIAQAELLIVGGTSLAVYPAAGLLDYYHGNKLVLINQDPTGYDNRADLLIQGKIGQVLGSLKS